MSNHIQGMEPGQELEVKGYVRIREGVAGVEGGGHADVRMTTY